MLYRSLCNTRDLKLPEGYETFQGIMNYLTLSPEPKERKSYAVQQDTFVRDLDQ